MIPTTTIIYLLSTVNTTTTTIIISVHHYHSSMDLTTTYIHPHFLIITNHPLSTPFSTIYPLSSLPRHPPLNMEHHCHRSTGGAHPWRNRTMRTCLTTWLQRRCWRSSVWGTTLSSPRSSRYLPTRAPDGLFSWHFMNRPNAHYKRNECVVVFVVKNVVQNLCCPSLYFCSKKFKSLVALKFFSIS